MQEEWQQISGDVNVADYGGLFGQLDTIGDTVYGVRLVEVINMRDACGDDWPSEEGDLVTEQAYVDVDGMDWKTAKEIMQSCGWSARIMQDTPDFPEEIAARFEYLKQLARDIRALAAWENRQATASEQARLAACLDEWATLLGWYKIDRMARAEMAHAYGGYTDGQSLTHKTLEAAMEYYGIPQGALWEKTA